MADTQAVVPEIPEAIGKTAFVKSKDDPMLNALAELLR